MADHFDINYLFCRFTLDKGRFNLYCHGGDHSSVKGQDNAGGFFKTEQEKRGIIDPGD